MPYSHKVWLICWQLLLTSTIKYNHLLFGLKQNQNEKRQLWCDLSIRKSCLPLRIAIFRISFQVMDLIQNSKLYIFHLLRIKLLCICEGGLGSILNTARNCFSYNYYVLLCIFTLKSSFRTQLFTLLERINMCGQKNKMKCIILWKILFAKLRHL